MAKVKISELPSLSPATLDTTYVVGVSGSTTYKISINQLTSSLDTTFATDLVTAALSSSLNSKLSTSSFNTFTQSYYSASASVDSRLDTLEIFSSSADNRYVLSGSITQTTWNTIANKPNDIVSSSTQISDLGFVTGSYTTLNSFNNLTQSFNSISQSFTTISGSFGDIDFSGINAVTESYLLFTQSYYSASASFDERIIAATNEQDLSYLATTGSNTFIGNQIISGSATISQGIHNWEFGSDGIIKLNNGYGEIYAAGDDNYVRIGTAAENMAPNAQIILGGPYDIFKIKSGPPSREWTFEGNGDFNLSGSINGASNLVTTSSFNTFTQSYYSVSASFDSRVDSLENATSSYLTSLNGAISSSTQVLNGSGIYSSSAQLPNGLISSSTQLPSNLISGSAQISALGFVSSSNLSSIRTITSASYAALTPVSGTLYIIIG